MPPALRELTRDLLASANLRRERVCPQPRPTRLVAVLPAPAGDSCSRLSLRHTFPALNPLPQSPFWIVKSFGLALKKGPAVS